MKYRIEEFGELRLVGYKRKFSLENGDCFNNIPAFWDEMNRNGNCEKMMQYNTNRDLCCLGVCTEGNGKKFDYFIATGSDKEIPDNMDELIVPANTYVIFECRGKMPDGQQNVWKRAFTEWFPTSGYELASAPQIEWYSDGDMTSDDYYSEIWLPIRKI